jgi:hypothetical protein
LSLPGRLSGALHFSVSTALHGSRGKHNKVKIDTKRRPHTIELVPLGAARGQVGVYKIEKGELYLTTGRTKGGKNARGVVTPKDFSGDDAPVYVMTREKDGK